jgi:hypothetical protein
MGYLFASGLGERYVWEDEDDGEEERGPVSGFAGTPMIADLRDFCRPEFRRWETRSATMRHAHQGPDSLSALAPSPPAIGVSDIRVI